MKMKVNFAFKKNIGGSYLEQNNGDLVFKPAPFSKNESAHSWTRDQNMIFKTMNHFFLNRNFALKLQGNC